jgi:hypothetical protein
MLCDVRKNYVNDVITVIAAQTHRFEGLSAYQQGAKTGRIKQQIKI